MKDQRIVPYHPNENMTQAAQLYGVDAKTFKNAYQAALDVAPPPTPLETEALNDKQKVILAFIALSVQQTGITPSQHEIAAGTGFLRETVQYHLRRLTKLGYISRSRKWRAIKLTKKATGKGT